MYAMTFRVLKDPGVRITYIGMACNFAMAVGKLTGGWMFNSEIIVADGWHSMTDLTSDVLTLATVSYTVDKSTGSRSSAQILIQTLCSLGLSAMLIMGGLLQGLRSATSLGEFYSLSDRSAIRSLAHEQDINSDAIWIAISTVILKEWLYYSSKSSMSLCSYES